MIYAGLHIIVSGRVQGVGYRAWLAQLAETLALGGWVRNRHDGWVEAVLIGPEATIEPALVLIERGPPSARVEDVAVRPAAPEETALAPADGGFAILSDL